MSILAALKYFLIFESIDIDYTSLTPFVLPVRYENLFGIWIQGRSNFDNNNEIQVRFFWILLSLVGMLALLKLQRLRVQLGIFCEN